MDEKQDKQNNLIDTTDCLEAISVFRGWKNFLFVITICCLLFLQTCFWLVNTGYIKTDDTESGPATALIEDTQEQAAARRNEIEKAAKQVAAEPNQPARAEVAQQQPQQQVAPHFRIKFKQLAWLIRFLNFVLIPAAALYCLTMLFSLKVSLLGRLGGINHISRAFFLSLLMLVLLLPWQRFFAGVVAGAMYTPSELLSSFTAVEKSKVFGTAFYYLRFTGYWLLVLLLLIFSQLRSARWAKAILRRLELI